MSELSLVEFLTARFAEDEKREWWEFDRTGSSWILDDRVLAEVEAKRRILDWHRPIKAPAGFMPNCEGCWEDGGMDGAPTYPCRNVKFLALPFADHPDYRPEWRP